MNLFSKIKLNPPKGKHSKEKLAAYRAHWAGVAGVRDELSRAYIYDGLTLSKLSKEAQVSFGTVNRFFHFGKGHGKLTYSYFHGPSATTVFGIVNALGLEIKLVKKGKPNGK